MREIVELYREESTPDYIQMAQCLIFLNDFGAVAKMLENLLEIVSILIFSTFCALKLPFVAE